MNKATVFTKKEKKTSEKKRRNRSQKDRKRKAKKERKSYQKKTGVGQLLEKSRTVTSFFLLQKSRVIEKRK